MPKKIVVCCDGTWNTAGQQRNGKPRSTNVDKIKDMIPAVDSNGVTQRVFYQPGVGTKPWELLSGGAFGYGLSQNVVKAYEFLVSTYEPGDQLFLFGFSRGAFTARSLAGLVRKSGILRPGERGRVKEAFELYRDKQKPTDPGPTRFRAQHSHEEFRIRFVGVWDTVGALGIPILGPRWLKPVWQQVNKRWSFHDTKLSTQVDGAFQALAIDEQRSVFEPTLWNQQPDAVGQVLEQAWFAGHHCAVGGGLTDAALPDTALLWMAERAEKLGLEFEPGALGGLRPNLMAGFGESRSGVYKLTRALHRPIGEASTDGRMDGAESVWSSATERYRRNADYRPPELVKYLKRHATVP
jgi:uncharacterized protein (DUF2235 family)